MSTYSEPFYRALFNQLRVQARTDPATSPGAQEVFDSASRLIAEMVDEFPHGNGIDGSTDVELITSSKGEPRGFVIRSSYHYMNEGGFYDGWFDFEISVLPAPSLSFEYDARFRIVDNGTNQRKSYLMETHGDIVEKFCMTLDSVVTWSTAPGGRRVLAFEPI